MARVCVWDLNLDAEYELAARGRYAPTRDVLRFVAAHRAAARGVLAAGDLVLGEDALPAPAACELVGRAWCPTPAARARLAAAGAALEAAPPVDVLRAVNDRAFCAALGQTLPHALHATTLEPLLAALADPAGPRDWLAKRAFGVAGRGRRKLRRGAPDAAERAWLEASLRQGGVQLEPFVEVLEECAVHGRVAEDGACRLGPPRRLECDAHGAWRASRALAPGELAPSVADALEREARRVGEALARAGYFGPFGVDAYRYRLDGAEAWQPRSEVNARYTLGWRAPAE